MTLKDFYIEKLVRKNLTVQLKKASNNSLLHADLFEKELQMWFERC